MQTVELVFMIAFLGYLLGSVKIKGLQLGSSGVLIAALVFGHYGYEIPALIREIGLALFVGSVGLLAGPTFLRNFRKQGLFFGILGAVIIIAGAAVTGILAKFFHLPGALAVGIFTGAMTSTPGLAAAMEAAKNPMASIGYGIAYPFGVVGVVLFVQILPKILKIDLVEEAQKIKKETENLADNTGAASERARKPLERTGLLVFSLCAMIGLALAKLALPLPGGIAVSLGIAGGPLLAGLLLGHIGGIGPVSLKVPKETLNVLRELGLILFLAGAGTGAGQGFVEIAVKYGWPLLIGGAIITMVPMIAGYLLATSIMKIELSSALAAICGGMTSTPALGVLITASGNEEVASFYAATYPVALILVVISSQLLVVLL